MISADAPAPRQRLGGWWWRSRVTGWIVTLAAAGTSTPRPPTRSLVRRQFAGDASRDGIVGGPDRLRRATERSDLVPVPGQPPAGTSQLLDRLPAGFVTVGPTRSAASIRSTARAWTVGGDGGPAPGCGCWMSAAESPRRWPAGYYRAAATPDRHGRGSSWWAVTSRFPRTTGPRAGRGIKASQLVRPPRLALGLAGPAGTSNTLVRPGAAAHRPAVRAVPAVVDPPGSCGLNPPARRDQGQGSASVANRGRAGRASATTRAR